jgi:hypothetical protein
MWILVTRDSLVMLLRVYPAAGRRGTGEALWFLTAKARLLLAAPARRTPTLSLPDLKHRRAAARFFYALVDRSLQHFYRPSWPRSHCTATRRVSVPADGRQAAETT